MTQLEQQIWAAAFSGHIAGKVCPSPSQARVAADQAVSMLRIALMSPSIAESVLVKEGVVSLGEAVCDESGRIRRYGATCTATE